MHGYLPLRKYKVTINISKQELICKLKNKVSLRNLVRYNFMCYSKPGRLLGIVSQDRIHLTSNVNGFNSCQVIMHGCIESIDNKQCVMSYHYMPNNYAILWDVGLVLVLVFLKLPIWKAFSIVGLLFAIELILCLISSTQTSTLFYELVGEAQKDVSKGGFS